jgi:glycerol-3-phosphate acyltransferase PlsY
MDYLKFFGVLVIAYLIGAIPFGLFLVRLKTGQDIRTIQSGRTGGTNAMRAAGFWTGFTTALLDVFKGASSVWIAHAILPDSIWLKVLAPILIIIGHNYSIYLIERNEDGKIRLGGGAGGAACVGGSLGLWPWSALIIVPIGFLLVMGLGYASVATMSVAIISSIIFAILAVTMDFPWEFILYGLIAEVLLMWALRPNIKRLLNGEERLVGWRARHLKTNS